MYAVIIVVAVVILAISGVVIKCFILKQRKRTRKNSQVALNSLGIIINSVGI
jgi:hypothetical protein